MCEKVAQYKRCIQRPCLDAVAQPEAKLTLGLVTGTCTRNCRQEGRQGGKGQHVADRVALDPLSAEPIKHVSYRFKVLTQLLC